MSVVNNAGTAQFVDYISKISELKDVESKKLALSEIKNQLEIIPNEDLKYVGQNVNYNAIFAELFSNDR